jgi:hypothetical protein
VFNHTLIKRALAAGLTIGAASFPTAAQARLELNPPSAPSASQPVQVVSGSTDARRSSSAQQSGFGWGDAGIGAAGAVVLLGAGAGTANAMRRRRGHGVVTG